MPPYVRLRTDGAPFVFVQDTARWVDDRIRRAVFERVFGTAHRDRDVLG